MNSFEIYFIRHGETDWNKARRLQGRADIPLNSRGKEQALDFHKYRTSSELTFDLVYSSPLIRAQETARIAFPNKEIHLLPGIEEMGFGDLEGVCLDEMTDSEKKFYSDWRSITPDSYNTQAPNGETKLQHQTRSMNALRSIFNKHEFLEMLESKKKIERLAIVSHGGTIRRFIEKTDFPITAEFTLGNCEFVVMSYVLEKKQLTFIK